MDLHVCVSVCMKGGLKWGKRRSQHHSVFLTYVNAFRTLLQNNTDIADLGKQDGLFLGFNSYETIFTYLIASPWFSSYKVCWLKVDGQGTAKLKWAGLASLRIKSIRGQNACWRGASLSSGCKGHWWYRMKGISLSEWLAIVKCLLMCSLPFMLPQVSKTVPTWQTEGESFITWQTHAKAGREYR